MLSSYIETVAKRYKSGISSEHSYRADLENLIRSLVSGVEITNEPSQVTECGNPDYVITRSNIPIGFIEAKDLGKDLHSKQYKEQFGRYRKALNNLIITDYLWFQFFQHGELIHEIRIGEIEDNNVKPLLENFAEFHDLITNFCTFVGQTIKSPKKLAEMMAAKARLLETILERAVTSDEKTQESSTIKGQYESFKEILIHDLTPKGFADIYAQTLAYGMFAARLHDTTLDDFSRQEAAELIPKTNPFLRKLFQYVAGYDIDERIKTTVDNLAEVFRATNVEALLQNLGKSTHNNDPIIHFYETFLAEYDPKLRKARGVWYTPAPVVNFIVRAVDDLLKSDFGLKDGLADISKTTIQVEEQGATISKGKNKGKPLFVDRQVHKVQILDPATGTGTFLAEVVKFIYKQKFKSMQGAWSGYVEEHLIPRLNGFELLMASYSMAHLKLDMLLSETGYKAKKEQRFNIYLTNSLEEHHPDTGTLFSTWLSSEANEANQVKRDTPVMVVMGNPPYSVSSSNKGEWIRKLIKDYKKDLNEKKLNLDDDYIKFIRYGQYYIEKNGEGILAYITNNSFLDGVTHRQMRKHLLETFDEIYILDLHGNSKKKETAADGSKDENVFDITQGVSINIFVKKADHVTEFAQVNHLDMFGERHEKYQTLLNSTLASLPWNQISYRSPEYFFSKKDFSKQNDYDDGFSLVELFFEKNTGIQTKRDALCLQFNLHDLEQVKNDFLNMDVEEIRKKYQLVADNRDWKVPYAISDLNNNSPLPIQILHRPFDCKWTYYTGKSKGFIGYPRHKTMRHMLKGNNYALLLGRQNKSMTIDSFLVTNKISEMKCSERTIQSYHYPLYLYPESTDQQSLIGNSARIPNFNMTMVEQIAAMLDLSFTSEKEITANTFAPIDLLDYIYAVLYSPTYRETYKEFLKINFPRVPYPKDKDIFWQLVKLGGELRQIHLLESGRVEEFITSYPQNGDNVITRKLNKNDWEIHSSNRIPGTRNEYMSPEYSEYQLGRIWINDKQYFDQIPLVAWEFYIGGYQPAQKWLKDRRGRELSYEDIQHYQKVIVALTETDRLMKEIDLVR